MASSLDKWKPNFDPSGAKYKCIVSNVSTPALVGTHAGFEMRDELWKRTNGQIYIDFKPLSILGGEVEVLNMLQMGCHPGHGRIFGGVHQPGAPLRHCQPAVFSGFI